MSQIVHIAWFNLAWVIFKNDLSNMPSVKSVLIQTNLERKIWSFYFPFIHLFPLTVMIHRSILKVFSWKQILWISFQNYQNSLTLVSSLSLQTNVFVCVSDLTPIKQRLILLTPAQQLIKSTIFTFHSHNCVHMSLRERKSMQNTCNCLQKTEMR